MRAAVTDYQMRCPTPDAPTGRPGAPGFDHLRMIGQAQVIVVAKCQQRPAVHHHFRALGAFKQRALAIEIVGTTGSQACGEIEGHAGLGVNHLFKTDKSHAGAGLLAPTPGFA